MHKHENNCNCGHPHDCNHTHDACGCGHAHDACSCGHAHGECCEHTHVPIPVPEHLTPLQTEFLVELHRRHYLPVACFSMTHTDAPERTALALEPVYISRPEDSMDQVKAIGSALAALCDMDLISLDYDCSLEGYAYEEYKSSALYSYFVQTMIEAAQRPDAAFNTPILELGSMALTDAGHTLTETLLAGL